MKIIRVEYSALFNLGNYNNEKLGFTAELEEGDNPETVILQLRDKAIEAAVNKGLGDESDIRYEISRKVRELRDIEAKAERAANEWNSVAEFLRAQGIKPDAPNLSLKALMPSTTEESASVIEAELEDDDAPF